MSIGTPNGILDITGATLRVSKMEFRQSTGFDTVLNNVARNTMLLMDETEQTTSNSWALKLPNAWVAEFHGYWASGSSGAPILFNFYNDSTSGTNGYTLSMNDTAISINYDGGSALGSATLSSTLNNDAYRKVAVIFERSVLDVSVDGEHVFHFADSQLRDRVYDNNSGYVTFTHSSTDERKLKNLKFTNGDKWVREIDSSNIAYVGGNVGIGTTIPGTKLDVSGTVRGTHLIGDGSAISAIQSSNVSDFGSNVTRIGTLETDLGDNSTRITIVSSNLSDNSSRITALESGDISISGDKTFTGDIIFESNVHMNSGNVFVANTVNMTVSDPIIELGSNNLNTGDLGIIMTRHGATNSNVAIVYDEDVDILRMGYTSNGASNSVISLDSNALAVSVQGNLEVGTGDLFVDTSTSRVGINVASPSYALDVDGDVNLSTGSTLRINGTPAVFSNWTVSGSDIYRSSGNVGIGASTPQYKLDVDGGTTEGDGDIMLRMFGAVNKVGKLIFGRTGTTNIRSHAIESITNAGGANNYMKFMVHDGGNTPPYETRTEVMTLLGDGNVGIGTATPDGPLHVYKDGGNAGQAGGGIIMERNYNYGCAIWSEFPSGGTVDCMNFRCVNNATDAYGGTPQMVLTHEGRVGIGTSSPDRPLEIAAGGGNAILNLKRTDAGTGQGALAFANLNSNVCAAVSAHRAGTEGGDLVFYTTPDDTTLTSTNPYLISERMRITSGGYVGIGTTSPDYVLETYDSSGIVKITRNANNNNWGGAVDFALLNSSNAKKTYGRIGASIADNTAGAEDGFLSFQVMTAGTLDSAYTQEKMRITSSGNVGIGTTSPSSLLSIESTSGNQMRLNYNADWYNVIERDSSGNLNFLEKRGASASLVNHMTIETEGNVGIGTTNPGVKFHVHSTATNTTILAKAPDTHAAILSAHGVSQGTGRLYVGQSNMYGGGIEYNGDNSPTSTGAGADYITLYRTAAGTHYWTAKNLYNSNDWEFRRYIKHQNSCFFAWINTGVSQNTYIAFNQTRVNRGNDFNTSNGIYTCPIGGVYHFSWGAIGSTTNTVYRYRIHVNNAVVGDVQLRLDCTASGSEYGVGERSIILDLNTNDTVRIHFKPDNNSSGDHGHEYTYFLGYLISVA